jgi:CRISP-associated protein Cas1
MLNRGKRSLAIDFCNYWKTRMIDLIALNLVREELIRPGWYECGEKRCILAEPLIHVLIEQFQKSIRQDIIDTQVKTFVRSLNGEIPFEIHRF